MKRLLLDVDGVLANMVQLYLDVLQEVLGIHKEPKDVTAWDIKTALGLSDMQDQLVWQGIQGPCRAFHMKPYPDALKWVPKLMAIADVHLVTTSVEGSPTWAHDRRQWVQMHFGNELADKITFTKQKHICGGDVFVDDRFKNVKSWNDHQRGVAVLWDHGYDGHEWPTSTRDWSHIFDLVKK